jgi:hypothetical protein
MIGSSNLDGVSDEAGLSTGIEKAGDPKSSKYDHLGPNKTSVLPLRISLPFNDSQAAC